MLKIEVMTDEEVEAQRRKIQRTLNRLYWAFMYIGTLFAAYGIGWFQGYTG